MRDRDRGPPDYEDPEHLQAIIEGLVRAQGPHTYNEGSDKGLLRWIFGVVTALLVILIPTAIVVYSDVQTLKSQTADLRADFRELKQTVERRP